LYSGARRAAVALEWGDLRDPYGFSAAH